LAGLPGPSPISAADWGLATKHTSENVAHAWLWKYLYEDVERDREFKAKVERALGLCSKSVPEDWLRAVREAKERHPAVMELGRRFQ
jgi:hypothetical protein